uniref:IS110 family transposase n=1 Tax=Paenisporosarcina sp. TG20 TaxID=1211706 RepID=UPI0003733D72
NAKHVKNVPGRKTDVKDAEWLAKLLRSGLIESNFVPSVEIRDLRDLTRYRKKLIQCRTAEQNRIHKILQDANIKLTSVLSNIFGLSGRRILEAMINGEKIEEPALQKMIDRRTKASLHEIASAINGRIRGHHRDMLRFHWDHMMYIENMLEELEKQIDDCLTPYRDEVELLITIPGVSEKSAGTFIAEMGVDMSVFKSAKHLASWAGVSPGNNESAGKKKTSRTTKGNKALKTMAVECVLATSRQDNRISAHRKRITKRQGKKKGQMASAHLLLTIVYTMLKTREPYQELGTDYMNHQRKERDLKMIEYLKKKGYTVSPTDQEVA